MESVQELKKNGGWPLLVHSLLPRWKEEPLIRFTFQSAMLPLSPPSLVRELGRHSTALSPGAGLLCLQYNSFLWNRGCCLGNLGSWNLLH